MKNKRDLGLVTPPHFVHDFSREVFLMLYSNNWLNFFLCLPLFHCNDLLSGLWDRKFWNFLIKPLINQEVKTKILISQEQKKVFKIKQNNFSSTSIFIIPQKKFLAHFWVGGFTLKKMYWQLSSVKMLRRKFRTIFAEKCAARL